MSSDKLKPPAIWKKAAASTSKIIPTTNNSSKSNKNCNNDEEESASSAKRIPAKPSSSATTTVGTMRSHSPRKMKTQIAKLVYNPSTTTAAASTTNSINRDDVNEIEKTVIVAAEVGDFQKKRQDRDREVKEIQEMLNEITKTPTKQKKETVAVVTVDDPPKVVVAKHSPPKQQPTTTIQRSKTDTNLRRPTARKIQPSKEAQTARCKSANVDDKNSPPKLRQKTYNSEEAQRYMQEQKKKRRSLQINDAKPSAIDKDEIKKRLENLRQNTQPPINRREEVRNGMNKEPESNLKPSGREAWPERVLKAPSPRKNEVRIEDEKEIPAKTSRVEPWADKVNTVHTKMSPTNHQDPSPLAENHKKIGLLRKPEFKDHSFSAIKDINMDKENLIIDNLTPQVSAIPTSRLQINGEQLLSHHLTPQILEHTSLRFKEDSKEQSALSSNKSLDRKLSESNISGRSLKRKSSPELDLKIPEAKLLSRTSVREKSVQVDPIGSSKVQQQQKNTDLPYWLKPTLVQAYPYNFIMAVRKKLEAIANPPAVASSSSSSMEQQVAKKTTTETPVSYPKFQRNNNVKRRIIDEEDKSLSKSVEKSSSNKENIGEPRLSRSFSEVTSNFSSISIQLPESNNTLSIPKPKPPQQQQLHDDDDTTVSSSIFSSPEKKKKNFNGRSNNSQSEALSPLSMDNITNLHIKSKSMMSNITLGRGDHFDNSSTISSHRRKETGSITNRSDGSVNFSQLLDDFNRSLSQVIEVNQQLKTTLVKSQIFSPEKKTNSVLTTNRVELAEYVSDFEESSNVEGKVESKKSYKTQTDSSIHEVRRESSKQSSAINTDQKSSSVSSSNEEEIPEEASQSSQNSIKHIQSSSRTINQSPISLGTQTFTVSSEETGGQTPTRTQTIHEENIDESPNKENMSGNQYSLDSLETSQHDDYIKSHINTSRGDYNERVELLSAGPPPSYKVSSESQARSSSNFINSSMDSEFVRIFNKSDMEISVLSLNRSLSESTVNYSSIGMYEKLIQNETSKSDHLAALLKMREKALIDRTKGQIAWLEVQKERYKTKGLVLQISAVKKKQRGILMKMEKEREEIKKLLQRTKVQRDDNKLRIPENRPFLDVSLLQQRRPSSNQVASVSQQQKQQQQQYQNNQQQSNSVRSTKSSSAIVRGYELETSRSLEQLLQKREEDLRRRREHVERLMEWHRRLDQEEAEVLQLERILLDYNNVHVQQRQEQQHQQNENVAIQERNPNQTKMEKKLREIDRSLRELSSISGADGSTDACVQGSGEFVRTSGTKLNKLWRRLTSQRIEKFLPNKKYKLCKADVEQLYEDAKLAVLHDFGENAGQMEVFLGQTSIISTPQPSNNSMEIPQLNLNFSSGGQSEEDIMMRGNYSPSAAEEGFHVPSTSSRDVLSDESNSKRRGISRNSSSALHSMPEGYSSSCSSQRRFDNDDESKTNKFKNTSSDVDSKSVFSTKSANVSKLSINYVLSSKNDVDQRVSGIDSTKNDNRIDISENSQTLKFSTKNESVPNESLSSQIGTISTKTSLSLPPSKSDIPEILEEDNTQSHQIDSQIDGNSTLSRRSTKPREILSNIEEDVISTAPELTSNAAESIETLNRVNESTIDSLSEVSKGTSVPEVDFSTNSRSSQIYSSYNANANENVSKFIESTKTGVSTASNLQSQLEKSVLKTQTSDITDGNVTSLIASISKCSKNSSDNVPITKTTNQLESASNIITPSESLKQSSSSIKSQTLNTASSTKSNTSKDNVSIETKPSTNSQTESRSSKTEIEEIAQTSNNEEKTPPTTNESRKSSEECATVSILKSLLNSTYNSNSIFISNQASNTASDIQAQLRTNGHDFSNWSNTTKEDSSPSSKDEQQQQSSIATQVSDETTLKSIKSIDNSTNSKHSIQDHPPTPVSKSASEGDIIHHSNQQTHNDSKTPEDNNYQSYSSAFEEDSSSSNQMRSSVIMSIKSPTSHQIESEPLTNAFYESDFTEGEETNIDDISLPKFESTGEEEQFNESQLEETAVNSTDFEKRLIDLDVSLKDLDATFEKALSPEKTLSPPRDDGSSKRNQQQQQNESALMPDIISEVELRRRHQAMLENELKQFEHAVPYMYVREIPNKPPPPYVPPAHGSPMTTIFPSEERIKDITFRRTKELYYEILNIDTKDENGIKPPSVLDENITNIYERIILDICKEYLTEYKPILTSADPNNFHSSLAFFNPPDRVKCMQEFIYKEVRKNLAMDKNTTEKSQLYSVYGHRGKRDHIGEIIIQEMFEEDNIWSNFYIEEEEVLELIIDEMIGSTVRDICIRVLEDEVPRDSITPTADNADGDESVEMRCNNST
ncbi:centrosome-associated protein 350-like isoform X2 [Episyrphus balteatus]|uniref:centrosome-associated protein 350-like isoform X2 n=1 Tax=Episyrphus balteatus TaxID=286459 RepID=UPI002486618D|nr:centrosome-associated protein 350-like isoform X2 [Episyrphus balteatus]